MSLHISTAAPAHIQQIHVQHMHMHMHAQNCRDAQRAQSSAALNTDASMAANPPVHSFCLPKGNVWPEANLINQFALASIPHTKTNTCRSVTNITTPLQLQDNQTFEKEKLEGNIPDGIWE